MSSIHLSLPVGQSSHELLSDVPKRAKTLFSRGMALLDRAYEKQPTLLQKVAASSIVAGEVRDEAVESELRSALGLSEAEASLILGTTSFLALMVVSTDDLPDKIVEALVESKILEPSNKQTIASLVRALREVKPSLTDTAARRGLANSVLPSLSDFETVVDVRIGTEGEKVISVPVVLVHLETDVANQRLWFQMTKEQVERLVEDLKKVLSHITQAEKMIGR